MCFRITGAGKLNFNEMSDFWKIVISLVTTYLGYAIGKNSSNDGNDNN